MNAISIQKLHSCWIHPFNVWTIDWIITWNKKDWAHSNKSIFCFQLNFGQVNLQINNNFEQECIRSISSRLHKRTINTLKWKNYCFWLYIKYNEIEFRAKKDELIRIAGAFRRNRFAIYWFWQISKIKQVVWLWFSHNFFKISLIK